MGGRKTTVILPWILSIEKMGTHKGYTSIMKLLILIRGVPGSGKSTLANILEEFYNPWTDGEMPWKSQVFEADQYFYLENGVYSYDKTKIIEAHDWCQRRTLDALSTQISPVIVANTFIKRWQMCGYYIAAKTYNYNVQEIICEGNFPNIHGCPQAKVDRMKREFEYA